MFFTGKAHADTAPIPQTTIVRIDNRLNPSADPVAASGNSVTVGVRYCSTCSYTEQTRVLSSISSSHDFVFPGGSGWDVYDIRVTINGSDLLIIDQLELYDDYEPYLVETWSSDNEMGWCLSTDAADGGNSHCISAVARPVFRFVF